jgi:dipeptidyl aminopeptidase/acylaminoacyl peptidase
VRSLGGGKLDAGAAAGTAVTIEPATISFGALTASIPDGSLVAVRKFGASGRSIWVTNLTRISSSPITFGRNDVSPAWSPRGKRLAFFRVVGNDAGVHIVDVTDASKDQFYKGAIDSPFLVAG